jgi:hypothetical protein
MGRYTVICLKEPENNLAALWIQGPDRAAITAAQHQIDQKLAADPETHGKHLAEGLWVLEIPPLKAFFEIHELDKQVIITSIHRSS